MNTLPIYDEKRGEYVEVPAPATRPDRPKRPSMMTPSPRVAAEPSPPPHEPSAGTVEYFLRFLDRMKQSVEDSGNAADAAILGELAEYLMLHRSSNGAEADCDTKPIFAVTSAYITALTTIMSVDESTAAQSLARKLVSLGYELPKKGGDTRGWKRLIIWRDRLARRQLPPAMDDIYRRAVEFARQDLTRMDLVAALEHAEGHDREPAA